MMKVFKPFKISIIITILNSHSVVKRQIKHFTKMNLPQSVEIIFIDDGSDPPLKFRARHLKNFNIYPSGDTRRWSMACARNLGAKIAEGEYLFMTDIDHILPRSVIDAVLNFDGDKMIFLRELAVLDRRGNITQNFEMLRKYGLGDKRYKTKNIKRLRHANTFAIKKSIYKAIDGYGTKYCRDNYIDRVSDRNFFNRYKKYYMAGKCKWQKTGGTIYTYPPGANNIPGLFHDLPRE